jgi:hypothetical protein
MERTIGNLGEEIRQHSNPYANLSQRGLLRSQTNALRAIMPQLSPKDGSILPRGARDLGDGYVLLGATDNCKRLVRECEGHAIEEYMREAGGDLVQLYEPDGSIKMVRWARLRLPNGQIARSAWKETLKPLVNSRMARNVKVSFFNTSTACIMTII